MCVCVCGIFFSLNSKSFWWTNKTAKNRLKFSSLLVDAIQFACLFPFSHFPLLMLPFFQADTDLLNQLIEDNFFSILLFFFYSLLLIYVTWDMKLSTLHKTDFLPIYYINKANSGFSLAMLTVNIAYCRRSWA